jgi:membrane peptidoglycan carboxypeptidase
VPILLLYLARVLLKKEFAVLSAKLNCIRIDVLPAHTFVEALVEAEDRRFLSHHGVDPLAVLAIPWRIMRNKQLSGASTITQQLVRVVTGNYQRSINRKLSEILLAVYAESMFSKNMVAYFYLHVAYFGWRMNGIEEACNRLGIDIFHASPREAASLIARLKYPEPRRVPHSRSLAILARENYILARTKSSNSNVEKSLNNDPILNIVEVQPTD